MTAPYSSLPIAFAAGKTRRATNKNFTDAVHPVIAVALALLCVWSIWAAGRIGLARFYSAHGMTSGSLESANTATSLRVCDPEAHYAQSIALQAQGKPLESIEALKNAIALRPDDYFLWMELGRARDGFGDRKDALAALKESVRLAPQYAQPRWQLGNFLLRQGNKQEAFFEMRRAVRRDTSLLPQMIELAWNANNGDAEAVIRDVKPQNANAQIALASYFVRHNLVDEGLKIYHTATDGNSLKNHREIIEALLAVKRFDEARELLRTPQASEQDRQAVLSALLAAGQTDEASALLKQVTATDKTRRTVLTGLLDAQKFDEAIELLRTTNSTEQERRTLLSQLIAAKRLDDSFEVAKMMNGAERGRRTVIKELIGAQKLGQALELARAEGTPEPDRQTVITALLKENMLTEAVGLLRVSTVTEQRRRELLKPLMEQKRFAEAYQVWSLGRDAAENNGIAAITDGGFENKIIDEQGFGWRIPSKLQAVRMTIDTREKKDGARSLFLEFSGNSKQTEPIISQLVVVNPNTRYQLNFAVRTREIMTACPPFVTIQNPDGGGVIARLPLPAGTNNWTPQSISFVSPARVSAVIIAVGRESVQTNMCPVFGSIWLDNFSMR